MTEAQNDYDVFNTTTPEEVADEIRKKRESFDSYAEYFNIPPDGTALVRFLDDRPVTFYQHRVWDKSLKNGQGGWRTLTCLRAECPLCRVADEKDKARYVGAYRLIHLDNREDGKVKPKLKIFLKGINTLEVLERKNRKKPLSSENIEVERIGTGFDTKYLFEFTGESKPVTDYEKPSVTSLKEIFKVQPEILARIAAEKGAAKSDSGNGGSAKGQDAPAPDNDDDIPF